MKPWVVSQLNTKLHQTRKNSRITSVHMRISHQTRIQNPSQNLSQRSAYRETTTAVCHIKRMPEILLVTFRHTSDVEPPIMIVFRQNLHQILREKHRIVVAENVPPDFLRFVRFHRLFHDPRHSNRRPESPRKRVRKPRRVAGDNHRRQIGI